MILMQWIFDIFTEKLESVAESGVVNGHGEEAQDRFKSATTQKSRRSNQSISRVGRPIAHYYNIKDPVSIRFKVTCLEIYLIINDLTSLTLRITKLTLVNAEMFCLKGCRNEKLNAH